MSKQYYSARTNPSRLTLAGLYWKFTNLYMLFRDRGYLEEKLQLNSHSHSSKYAEHEAALALNFQPFPVTKWSTEKVTEENVFDAIEFFNDYISKPIDADWGGYNETLGRTEYREKANQFLWPRGRCLLSS